MAKSKHPASEHHHQAAAHHIIKPPIIMILARTKRRRITPTRPTNIASKDISTQRPRTNSLRSNGERRRRYRLLFLVSPVNNALRPSTCPVARR